MDRLSGTLAVTISNQNQQITQLKSMLTQLDKNLAATQSALNQSATTLTQLQSDLESTRADLGQSAAPQPCVSSPTSWT